MLLRPVGVLAPKWKPSLWVAKRSFTEMKIGHSRTTNTVILRIYEMSK